MATNDFLPFAAGGGANVESQGSYAVDALRPIGNQPGIAVSALNNKALRQATWIAAQLAQFLSDQTTDNVLDDANATNIQNTLKKALKKAPTIQKFLTGSGTYTLPTGPTPLYIKITMAGGGGGGGGSDTSNGSDGNDTTFGSLLTAGKGFGAIAAIGGVGGNSTIGVGAAGLALSGGNGNSVVAVGNGQGVMGGMNALGGAGAGQTVSGNGFPGVANTGAGGGGAGGTSGASQGAGGGAGGFLTAIIASPASTYAYSVGAGGAGGTGADTGGAGGDGVIIVEEFYQ